MRRGRRGWSSRPRGRVGGGEGGLGTPWVIFDTSKLTRRRARDTSRSGPVNLKANSYSNQQKPLPQGNHIGVEEF